jgi:Trk K+ transport system NAD-binding subunit
MLHCWPAASTPGCGWSSGSTTGGSASTWRNCSARPSRSRATPPHTEAADASTTVLSDAETAAPALAAAAVAGTNKVLQAQGVLLRAAERPPGGDRTPAVCTLAVLSGTRGRETPEGNGEGGPLLLPSDAEVARAADRSTMVLEKVTRDGPPVPVPRLTAGALPLGSLFSRQLLWLLGGFVGALVALAVVSWLVTGEPPIHAAYLALLDLFAIDNPAIGEPASRKIIQLLAGLIGLLLLPLLVAAALDAMGTFRDATTLRRPPRGISGHVVLLGLGKIGARVLTRLRELDIPVVCVERDPKARGVALARSLRVPTVIGDITEEGVLESAHIRRSHALLALTSSDSTNLEAVLYARGCKPDVNAVMRLHDDQFALAVYRTLRDSHPQAMTRSRSVSAMAAPAFAAAMMGRQIMGAIPIERKVLLFVAVEVRGHPQLEGRTVGEAFRPGAWRVLALDPTGPGESEGSEPSLIWDPHGGYVLQAQDRVVLVATRQGLGELLGRRAQPSAVSAD